MPTPDLLTEGIEYVLKHGNVADIVGLIMSGVGSAITAMVGFGVKFLRDLSRSVERLNTNIEVLILKTENHEKRLDDQEGRIRLVERHTQGDQDNEHTSNH